MTNFHLRGLALIVVVLLMILGSVYAQQWHLGEGNAGNGGALVRHASLRSHEYYGTFSPPTLKVSCIYFIESPQYTGLTIAIDWGVQIAPGDVFQDRRVRSRFLYSSAEQSVMWRAMDSETMLSDRHISAFIRSLTVNPSLAIRVDLPNRDSVIAFFDLRNTRMSIRPVLDLCSSTP